MKFTGMKLVCRLLIASLMLFQFPGAHAGIVGAEQVLAVSSAEGHRAVVLGALNRAEVSGQLQAMGVDPQQARDRVAAMSNDEVRTVAGNVEALPAGAMNSGWGWALLIVIGLVVYFNWK